MAVGTNFNADHVALDGRARVERIAAGAMHLYGMIIGMDSFFHGRSYLLTGLRNHGDGTYGRVARSAGNFKYIASMLNCNDGLDAQGANADAAEALIIA